MTHRRVLFSVMAVAMAALTMVTVTAGAGVAEPAAGPPSLGRGFLWGVASSGYQSEGYAPDSNWSRYAAHSTDDRYGNSVDFFHRYAADIELAGKMGVQVYRISVEWARVQPRPGTWDEQGLRFYDNVVRAIRAAGMRPMITLDHWVYPGWEVDRGGWRRPGMLDDWLANARRVVDRFAAYDPLWVTFNEPLVYVAQELRTGGLGLPDAATMTDRLVAAHSRVYDYIHARRPNAMVTSNAAFITGAESAADVPFVDRVAGKLDYIGIDYYYGASVAEPFGMLAALQNKPWSSPLTPEGIYYALRFYARKFPGRPLYIVENGMPTENAAPRGDGWTRANNLRDTVYWLQRAKADGMNVIGYNYWSLTDNFEWGSYTPRFGLYTVEVKTDPSLTRRPTDAVPAYRELIADNGVRPGYTPTRPPVFCSIVDPPSSCIMPVQ